MSASGVILQLAAAAPADTASDSGRDVIHVFGVDLTGAAAVIAFVAGVLGLAGTIWRALVSLRKSLRPIDLMALRWETNAVARDGTKHLATNIAAFVHNKKDTAQRPIVRVVEDPGWWRRRLPRWHRRLEDAGEIQQDPPKLEIAADAWERVGLTVIHDGDRYPKVLVIARTTPRRVAAVAPAKSSAAIR